MKPSQDQIEHKMELFERMASRKIKKLDRGTIPHRNIPNVYRSAGSKFLTVGLFKFSLGECGGATNKFTRCTKWYHDAITEFRARRDSPTDNFEGETTLLDYLYCGLLCGDDDLLREAAELVAETPIDHYKPFSTEWRYYYTQALAASILETGDQQAHLDALDRTIPDHDDAHETFFTALWIALSGVEAGDEDQFYEGVEQFLEWHDGQTEFETKTSAEDLVCKQVAALIVLARRHGMDITVDSEYIPECLSEIG